MKSKLALLISVVFSPFLVIAVFSVFVIYYYSLSVVQFISWSAALGFFVILMPLGYIQFLIRRGKITDSHLGLRDQRILPFVMALLGCVLLLVFYRIAGAPKELISMVISLIANGAIFLAITRYWKISMHASSFASSVMIISLLVDLRLFWLNILLAPIFWARLYRQKHNFWQLLIGAVLSSIITFTVIWSMNP